MFLNKLCKTNKKLILIASVSFFLFEILIFYAVSYVKNNEIENIKLTLLKDSSSKINIERLYLKNLSNVFYETTIKNNNISNLMLKATKTKNKNELNKLRDDLFKQLNSKYLNMKKYSVRQLHFHLPNSVSFLRFHRPKKFGDSLINIRSSINYVNEMKKPISVFEEGRIFNGFRNIFPIFKNKQFVGSVEISYSFSAIQTALSKIDNSAYLFIIKSDIVAQKVFNNESKNYKISEFEGYSYDVKTLKNTKIFHLYSLLHINNKISNFTQKRLKKGKKFAITFKNRFNKTIVISFIPIKNLSKNTVAYIVHYEFKHSIDVISSKNNIMIVLLSILLFIVIVVLSKLFLNMQKRLEHIKEFATHDELTKIYNRHGVYSLIDIKLKELSRYDKELSVIFFDIDFFKKVNDIYGHDIGDYILQTISKQIIINIRDIDIFGRWGGEEFIIFLSDVNVHKAIEIAEKLRAHIEQYNFDNVENITCSFGVVQIKKDEQHAQYLKRVDQCLYAAKESGRNCVKSELD